MALAVFTRRMRPPRPERSLETVAYPGAVALPAGAGADEHAASLSHSTALLLIVLAAVAGVFGLTVIAPSYFTARGFPLDDAWIHAVYGRELARTGIWAYNPGIPATGSTSPLWSLVLAGAHLAVDQRALTIVLIKWIGFLFHVLTALTVYLAFPLRSAMADHAAQRIRLLGAMLVALHPDLISASVSGMEVPLATLVAAALVWAALPQNLDSRSAGMAHVGVSRFGDRVPFTGAARPEPRPPKFGAKPVWAVARGGGAMFAILSAAAFLARPELALIAVVLPLVAAASDRRAARLLVAAGLGIAMAAAGLALRNLLVSGMPLPATFYAKVGQGADPITALKLGFGALLPQLTFALPAVGLGSAALILNRMRAPARRCAAASCAFVAALVYCVASFLLVTPHDPSAFYHQRYILPALPLLLGSATALVGAALPARPSIPARFDARRLCGSVAGALLVFALVMDMPARYHHLANDARNVDDVQVAIGRFLADAAPTDVVWAVDAGAVRYFGNAFVVDLMGLNTPALLGGSAQSFLDAHRPRYLEAVPLWSYLDEASARALPLITFAPTTRYTVTRFAPMQTHQLVRCDPGVAGEITVRSGARSFTCAADETGTGTGR